jgi:hypothetical protein
MACGAGADPLQLRGRRRQIGEAQRIAIHGGGVEGRLGAQGGKIMGQRAPKRLRQRYGLFGKGLRRRGQHAGQCFGDREKGGGCVHAATIAQGRTLSSPYLPCM